MFFDGNLVQNRVTVDCQIIFFEQYVLRGNTQWQANKKAACFVVICILRKFMVFVNSCFHGFFMCFVFPFGLRLH